MGGPLSEGQRERIITKIKQIEQDIRYLVRTGAAGAVYGGTFLRDANFQRRRAEVLQQVLDVDDPVAVSARALKVLAQADSSRDTREAERLKLEAALLLWAIEPDGEGVAT